MSLNPFPIAKIHTKFSQAAANYDTKAQMHRYCAKELLTWSLELLCYERGGVPLSELPPLRLAEIGSGTGVLSLEILSRAAKRQLPLESLTLIEPSAQMIALCKEKLALFSPSSPPCFYCLSRADSLSFSTPFDLILSNMALHWIQDLKHFMSTTQTYNLRGKGLCAFSTIGPHNFQEWQKSLKAVDAYNEEHASLASQLFYRPELLEHSQKQASFFQPFAPQDRTGLSTLKVLGAGVPIPRQESTPKALNIRSMRKALQHLRQNYTGLTWDIHYGAFKRKN